MIRFVTLSVSILILLFACNREKLITNESLVGSYTFEQIDSCIQNKSTDTLIYVSTYESSRGSITLRDDLTGDIEFLAAFSCCLSGSFTWYWNDVSGHINFIFDSIPTYGICEFSKKGRMNSLAIFNICVEPERSKRYYYFELKDK